MKNKIKVINVTNQRGRFNVSAGGLSQRTLRK